MSRLPLTFKIVASFALLALFWGGSFVAIKAATTELSAWFGAGLRMLIASFVLFTYLKLQKQKCLVSDWKTRSGIWVAGLFGMAFPFGLLFWAEKSITAGLAGLLNASVPIWLGLIILCARPTHESKELSVKNVVSVIFGFVGVFIIFQPAIGTSSYFWGAIAAAGAALSYAIANILTQRYIRRSDITLGQNLFEQHMAAVTFLFLGAFLTNGINVPAVFSSITVWGSLLYLGACSTAFALLMYFFLLKEVGSVRASIVTYLMPITALILDYLFYSNIPHLQEIIGASIVLFSISFLKKGKSKVSTVHPLPTRPKDDKGPHEKAA